MGALARLCSVALAVAGLTWSAASFASEGSGGKDAVPSLPGAELLPGFDESVEKLVPARGPDRFLDVFSPFATEIAALSPDGRFLAYALREGEQLAVIVVDVDHPAVARARVVVATDAKATPRVRGSVNPFPEGRKASIIWMQWISVTRVVFQADWGSDGRPILSFDVDGKNERILATNRTSQTYKSPGRIMAVSASVPGNVIIETSGIPGMDCEHYWLDVEKSKFQRITVETMAEEKRLLEARRKQNASKWQTARENLAALFPEKRIELVENDGDGQRFLVLVEGTADSGGFYVFEPKSKNLWEFCRRMPALDGDRAHVSSRLEFPSTRGGRFSGILTLPRNPRSQPVPVIVVVAEESVRGATGEFKREVQAIADMGLAVLQFEHRAPSDATTVFSRQQKQMNELMSAIEHLPVLPTVNPHRMALYGEKTAGHAVLLALKTHPERFRGAVTLQPLNHFKGSDDLTPWTGAPKTGGTQSFANPPSVLMLGFAGRPGHEGSDPHYQEMQGVAMAWRHRGIAVEVGKLSLDFRAGGPRARAEVFQKIETFLLASLFDFGVRVGDPQKVDP